MIESTGEWQHEWLRRGVRVHVSAIVDAGAEIGKGSTVWHFTHIRESAKIGSECTVGQCCYIDATVAIGPKCKIANGVQIYAGVTIEDSVFIGPNTTFTNDLWPRAVGENGAPILFCDPARTRIESGASIGAGCVILPVVVGASAMVGAGSVVAKDIAPRTRYLSVIDSAITSIRK